MLFAVEDVGDDDGDGDGDDGGQCSEEGTEGVKICP